MAPETDHKFDLEKDLQKQRKLNLYRKRRVTDGPTGPVQVVDGRSCLSFCSNDYLGLAGHPDVISAAGAALSKYGVGSGASHLVNGHSRAHHQLEEELAEFTGRARALLFSSGYMANLGVVSALMGREDEIYQDRLNHASLIDAARGSRAELIRYAHNAPQALEERLQRARAGRRLVMTDGVFSMDGDIADLPQLQKSANQHGAWLTVDDAHGFGVLGEKGQGVIEYFHLPPDSPEILMCTLGKALGTFGAFVAGSEALIETMIQRARTYIYTTALPPAVAAASSASLKLMQKESWRREKLTALIERFRSAALQLGLQLLPSVTPIQPILVGTPGQALAISEGLLERGFLVTPIRPPTVPEGTSRLRVTFSAGHEEHQVDELVDALDQLLHG